MYMEEKNINGSDKQEILEAIGSLTAKVGSLVSSQDSLAAKVDSLAIAHNETDKTLHEVVETMNSFATDTEGRFGQIDKRFEQIDQRFEQIDQHFEQIDQRFERLEKDVGVIKATIVTKDYLDEKLGKSYGDAVAMVRKEDDKVDNLAGLLLDKKLLTRPEAKKIVLMGPFPKAS